MADANEILSWANSLETEPSPQRNNTDEPPALAKFGMSFVEGAIPGYGERPGPDATLAQRAGHMSGESALTALGLLLPASKLKAPTKEAITLLQKGRDVAYKMGQSFKAAPKKTLGVEGLVGAGAGTAGFYAEQQFPNSPVATFVAEFAGGMGTEAALKTTGAIASVAGRSVTKGAAKAGKSALEILPVVKVGKYIRDKFKRGQESMNPMARYDAARSRMERAGLREEEAKTRMAANLDEPILEKSEEIMPFAMRAAEPMLLNIERAVMDSAKDGFLLQQRADVLRQLNDDVIQAAEFGDAEGLRVFLEGKSAYYQELMETRVSQAAADIEETLSGFRNVKSEKQANLIAASKLESYRKAARDTEKQLWKDIPDDVRVPTNNFTKKYEELENQLTKIKRADMPFAASWLAKMKFGKNKGKTRIGQTATIQEARDLVGELRRSARLDRSPFGEQNLNRARIADELAESINEDLLLSVDEVSDGASASVIDAVNYSRAFHDTWSKPSIDAVFERTTKGQRKIGDTQVLDFLFSGSKNNRENFNSLMTAVKNDVAMRDSVKDYFRYNYFSDDGFDLVAAERFMKSNKRLLDDMPDFKAEIQKAIETKNLGPIKEAKQRAIFEPYINAATVFAGKPAPEAIRDVLREAEPGKEMARLISLTRRDKTGRAKNGLKEAWSQHVLGVAKTGNRSGALNVLGPKFVDGGTLDEMFNQKGVRTTLSMLFTPAEQARWGRIRATARRVSLAQGAKNLPEGVGVDNLASQILGTGARIVGARIGGASTMSPGGSLQTASIVSSTLKEMFEAGIENPPAKIIADAVANKELFDALFETTDVKLAEKVVDAYKKGIIATARERIKPQVRPGVTGAATLNLLRGEEEQQQ
jgi:hypothetical protein